MNTIKIVMEALDSNPITPRTGKAKVKAEIPSFPEEGKKLFCFYRDEDCESPGVHIETNGIEQMGNEIKFYNYEKRAFKITLV
jgi:hypothetical protein